MRRTRTVTRERTFRVYHRSGYVVPNSTPETSIMSLVKRASTRKGVMRVLNNILHSADEIWQVEEVYV